jgi:hypothetical protein
MSKFAWIIVLGLLLLGWRSCRSDEPAGNDGAWVTDAPSQSPPRSEQSWQEGDFVLRPLADFSLQARVLSREDYRVDTESELAPTDLALGWQAMSDSAVLDKLKISQSGRWYHYRWGREGPPIPAKQIVRSSANMHLIPANDAVAEALAVVGEDQLIALRGQLVEVERPRDGWRWRSSTSREDSGAGSCEVIWVESLSILR